MSRAVMTSNNTLVALTAFWTLSGVSLMAHAFRRTVADYKAARGVR